MVAKMREQKDTALKLTCPLCHASPKSVGNQNDMVLALGRSMLRLLDTQTLGERDGIGQCECLMQQTLRHRLTVNSQVRWGPMTHVTAPTRNSALRFPLHFPSPALGIEGSRPANDIRVASDANYIGCLVTFTLPLLPR
jgi:hypothetical protein